MPWQCEGKRHECKLGQAQAAHCGRGRGQQVSNSNNDGHACRYTQAQGRQQYHGQCHLSRLHGQGGVATSKAVGGDAANKVIMDDDGTIYDDAVCALGDKKAEPGWRRVPATPDTATTPHAATMVEGRSPPQAPQCWAFSVPRPRPSEAATRQVAYLRRPMQMTTTAPSTASRW